MARLVFADAHGHSNPAIGMGASRIAERFRRAGGWFMALVALSPRHYGLDRHDLEGYRRVYDLHASECRVARESGLRVSCLAGMHPADVDFLINKARMRPLQVLELGKRVVELAAEYCRRGLLDGIGEVGRQHYATKPSHVVVAQRIMEYAMLVARENGLIVHLHLENDGAFTPRDVAGLAARLGVPRDLVFLHHARPGVLEHGVELGLPATTPGLEPVLRAAFARAGARFMVESDHIDDPGRPGTVVYPWDMVSNQIRLLEQGVVGEDSLYRVNVDNIVRYYGVEPP